MDWQCQSVPALERALRDKHPHVRKCAALALKDITGKDYDYDKTGLPDPQRIREQIESLIREGSKKNQPEAK